MHQWIWQNKTKHPPSWSSCSCQVWIKSKFTDQCSSLPNTLSVAYIQEEQNLAVYCCQYQVSYISYLAKVSNPTWFVNTKVAWQRPQHAGLATSLASLSGYPHGLAGKPRIHVACVTLGKSLNPMSQSPHPVKLGNQITQTRACHTGNVSSTYYFHFDLDY